MKQPVFVYGILLSDATVGATLHGWKLESFGNMTVTQSEGDHVLGGIVYADPETLRRYDRIEGCYIDEPHLGYYRCMKVEVDTLDGATVEAWVYVMNEDKRRHGGPISPWHAELRARELTRLGMMTSAELETIPAP